MWKLARARCVVCGYEYVAMCESYGLVPVPCRKCLKKGESNLIDYQETPPGVDLSALVLSDEEMQELLGKEEPVTESDAKRVAVLEAKFKHEREGFLETHEDRFPVEPHKRQGIDKKNPDEVDPNKYKKYDEYAVEVKTLDEIEAEKDEEQSLDPNDPDSKAN